MQDTKYKKDFKSLEVKYSYAKISFSELKKEILKLKPLYVRLQNTILELSNDLKNKNKILKLFKVRDNLARAFEVIK